MICDVRWVLGMRVCIIHSIDILCVYLYMIMYIIYDYVYMITYVYLYILLCISIDYIYDLYTV